ncbi:MAG: hypothetical protein PHS93_09850 [Candidatus Omnitrophica bacterium]|nr:hypothetical protein [Candidatus Omnitrophota bacterium]
MLIDEDGSKQMKAFFCKFGKFHMLSLCFAETLGVLKTKYFYRKNISKIKYFRAETLLSIYCKKYIKIHDVKIAHIDNVFCNIADFVTKYKVDFIDAFQIYYLKKESLLQHTRLITADSVLEKAAKSEKLNVWNCLKDKIP